VHTRDLAMNISIHNTSFEVSWKHIFKYNCNINCHNVIFFPSNDLFFADKAPRAAPRMKEDDSDKLTKQLHTYFLGK
jgi:hypothetical protein